MAKFEKNFENYLSPEDKELVKHTKQSVGNKYLYPLPNEYGDITYRQWLIGMIASGTGVDMNIDPKGNAELIINQANAIIEQLDKEANNG